MSVWATQKIIFMMFMSENNMGRMPILQLNSHLNIEKSASLPKSPFLIVVMVNKLNVDVDTLQSRVEIELFLCNC